MILDLRGNELRRSIGFITEFVRVDDGSTDLVGYKEIPADEHFPFEDNKTEDHGR